MRYIFNKGRDLYMKALSLVIVIAGISMLCACGGSTTDSGSLSSVSQSSTATTSSATTSSVQSSTVSLLPTIPVITTGKLNDTGVVHCGDYAYTDSDTNYDVTGSGVHNNDLNCSTVGAGIIADGVDSDGDVVRGGQDALYGRDVTHNDNTDGQAGFSYSKLNSNGVPLADQTQGLWSCVKDQVTGLIWEVKTTSGLQGSSLTYGFHSVVVSNCLSDICTTNAYIEEINAIALCGASDWRLPTNSELLSLVNRNNTSPAIDTRYFPRSGGGYWSSSAYDGIGLETWFLGMTTGVIRGTWVDAGAGKRVRLVRGTSPQCEGEAITCNSIDRKSDAIYSDSSTGTVLDGETGLMWQKCSLGLSGSNCTEGTIAALSWQSALAAANENSNDGYDDWRLPNINELESLVDNVNSDVSNSLAAINRVVFPNTLSGAYWSSTPKASEAWYVGFWIGSVLVQNKDSRLAVRLVRNGD